MEKQFITVTDADELERLLAQSHSEPVIVFKHSTTCPISGAAYQEMSHLDGEVALVVVQRAREVSRAVEARTGVRHESPQAIVLRNGQSVWSASHWNVTSDAVERAFREHS